MTPQSCHGCKDYRGSLIYKLACYRSKSFKSGRIVHATPDAGFSAELETHESPSIYDDRADGDHCGPSRIHFKAGEGVI
jgi:hypothetical protein